MLKKSSERSPIWEASNGPLFIKSIWMDNQGYRHFILDHGHVATKKRRTFGQPHRVQSRENDSCGIIEEELENLQLIGSSDILATNHGPLKEQILSTNQQKLCRKLLKNKYSVDLLRKHLNNNIKNSHNELQKLNDKNCNNLDKTGGDILNDLSGENNNLLQQQISDHSKNQLTERVLQWLDLAGKNTLVRPESEVPKASIKNIPSRRIFTAEIARKSQLATLSLAPLKRPESVHHLSITLNEEDLETHNSSRQTLETYRSGALKFGDFFPTTYRCARKFLSHSSTYRHLKSPPTYMNSSYSQQHQTGTKPSSSSGGVTNTAGGVGGSSGQITPKNSSMNKSRKSIGKIGKTESMENQYRNMIHRQILETSCNTQLAKRQLHIFMPNLPNKKNLPNNNTADCESCLSTVVSDVSKK